MNNMGWQTLTDTCAMPFGKYKGVPMQDIPASYLHYLWTKGMKKEVGKNSVADYINKSLNSLKLEDKDLIWD
jgi:uncharacterized protein (DUF3820 family)